MKVFLLAIMITAASISGLRRRSIPRWLAIAGLVFAPFLALSGLAVPLESDALYASLSVTLLGLLAWVAAITFVVARRAPVPVRASG